MMAKYANNTQRQHALIERALRFWEAKLTALQIKCKHKQAIKIAKSNTGNYDPSADAYWYQYQCPDCGRHWTEDQ